MGNGICSFSLRFHNIADIQMIAEKVWTKKKSSCGPPKLEFFILVTLRKILRGSYEFRLLWRACNLTPF
jgi:hypothetical protein